MNRIVFNGRFFEQAQTGVQRYAIETLVALDQVLHEKPYPVAQFELAVPQGVLAAVPPLRHIEIKQVGSLHGHLWEQIALPLYARDALLINFSYSGPLFKRRQLITVHDATVPAMPNSFSWRYRKFHTAAVKALAPRVLGLMTVSDFSKRELAQRFGISRSDVIVGLEGGEHVLRAGSSAEDELDTVRRYGLEPGQYVLTVGSVKANKNFGLIGSAVQLLSDFPWKIAVAGAKNERVFGASHQQSAAGSELLRFLGFVSDKDLSALYRHAACFVLPSLYEGFGLPAVEAMNLQCPVLAADAASIPEVCADGALYFDPHSADSLAAALQRIAHEPELRAQLVKRAAHRVKKYTWRGNAEILLDWITAQTAAQQSKNRYANGNLQVAINFSAAAHSKPHVVHVIECMSGGTLDFLVLATRELLAAGIQQSVIYSRRPDSPDDLAARFDPRVQLIELPAAKGLHIEFARALYRELRSAIAHTPCSAVHFHSSKAGFVGRLALVGTRSRPPAFYSPHGLSYLNRRKRIVSAVRWALERFAAVVQCQPVACGASEGVLLRRLSKRTAFVLENPVAPEYFSAARKESTEPLYVVAVGRLCEQKAPDVFAELAVRFAIAEFEAKFVWIGGGEKRYEDILHGSGVEVTGWLSQAQVRERLQQAAIYVQTSQWEGMPMAVLQALAMGLPCVVTNVVGNRDAVRHGKTGFVARDMDRMAVHVAELADNAALRLRMGQAARADAIQRFSTTRFRQSLLQLYGFAEPDEAPQDLSPSSVAINALQTRPATLNG